MSSVAVAPSEFKLWLCALIVEYENREVLMVASVNHSRANSITLLRDNASLPRRKLLHWVHNVQITAANKSGSLLPTKIQSKMSIKEMHALSKPWFHFGIELHKGRRSEHRNKAWTASSCYVLQASQQPSMMILRRTKFSLVGRAFLHAFHARRLILLGTWGPQILFHSSFNTSTSNEPGCFLHCSSYKNL